MGVAESGPSPSAYAVRETVAGLLTGGRVGTAAVAATLTGAASQLALVQRRRARLDEQGLAVQSSALLREGRAAMEDHLLMVAGFLGVMSQLMLPLPVRYVPEASGVLQWRALRIPTKAALSYE